MRRDERKRYCCWRNCPSVTLVATVAAALLLAAVASQTKASGAADAAASADEPSAAGEPLASVARIVATRCLECHSGEAAEAGYDMSTLAGIATAGDSGAPAIVAGEPDQSELYLRLVAEDESMRMPAGGPFLSATEIDAIGAWIEADAASGGLAPDTPLGEIAAASDTPRTAPAVYPQPLPVVAVAGIDGNAPQSPGEAISLFTGGYLELLQWNAADGKLQQRWPAFGPFVGAIAIGGDGTRIAAAHGVPGEQGRVTLLDTTGEHGVEPVDVLRTDDVPADIAFSPDGRLLAVARLDGSLTVIRTEDNATAFESVLHADAVLAVAWSADGKRLLTASRDRTARVLEVDSWRPLSNHTAHERSVAGVSAVSDSTFTLDHAGALRLWPSEGKNPRLRRDLPSAVPIDIISHKDRLFVPLQNQVLRTGVRWEEIDDGKDDEGKPKTRRVPRWDDWPPLQLPTNEILTSLAVTGDGALIVGTQSGSVYCWPRAAQERDADGVTNFTAAPR